MSERFPTHQNASDCISTHPNASEQVQTRPKTFKNVRKRQKMHENFAKTSRSRGELLGRCVNDYQSEVEHQAFNQDECAPPPSFRTITFTSDGRILKTTYHRSGFVVRNLWYESQQIQNENETKRRTSMDGEQRVDGEQTRVFK